MILPEDFFRRDTLRVARELIGCTLVSRVGGKEVRGMIVETEAYRGPLDPAAHSYRGRTERVRALYEGKGLAYIYLIYGMHWCLNLSCGHEGEPDCVLLRALEPVGGIDVMIGRRKTDRLADLCSGPGKLCAALGVTKELYGVSVFDPDSPLTVEAGAAGLAVESSPRIGIDYAGDAKSWPWRFTLSNNKYVSRRP